MKDNLLSQLSSITHTHISNHLEIHARYHAHSVTIRGVDIYMAPKSQFLDQSRSSDCFHTSCIDLTECQARHLIKNWSWILLRVNAAKAHWLTTTVISSVPSSCWCKLTGWIGTGFGEIWPICSHHICNKQWMAQRKTYRRIQCCFCACCVLKYRCYFFADAEWKWTHLQWQWKQGYLN